MTVDMDPGGSRAEEMRGTQRDIVPQGVTGVEDVEGAFYQVGRGFF